LQAFDYTPFTHAQQQGNATLQSCDSSAIVIESRFVKKGQFDESNCL